MPGRHIVLRHRSCIGFDSGAAASISGLPAIWWTTRLRHEVRLITLREAERDPLDELRHELKNPLTTIHGRAQLLARAVRRSPSLADEEQAKLLGGLAAIEAAVLAAVTVIDGLSQQHLDGRNEQGPRGSDNSRVQAERTDP